MDGSSNVLNIDIKKEALELKEFFQEQWDTFWSNNFVGDSCNSVLFKTIMDCEEWNLTNNTFLFLFSYFFFVQEEFLLKKYFDQLKNISKNYENNFRDFLLDMNFRNVCKDKNVRFIKSFIFDDISFDNWDKNKEKWKGAFSDKMKISTDDKDREIIIEVINKFDNFSLFFKNNIIDNFFGSEYSIIKLFSLFDEIFFGKGVEIIIIKRIFNNSIFWGENFNILSLDLDKLPKETEIKRLEIPFYYEMISENEKNDSNYFFESSKKFNESIKNTKKEKKIEEEKKREIKSKKINVTDNNSSNNLKKKIFKQEKKYADDGGECLWLISDRNKKGNVSSSIPANVLLQGNISKVNFAENAIFSAERQYLLLSDNDLKKENFFSSDLLLDHLRKKISSYVIINNSKFKVDFFLSPPSESDYFSVLLRNEGMKKFLINFVDNYERRKKKLKSAMFADTDTIEINREEKEREIDFFLDFISSQYIFFRSQNTSAISINASSSFFSCLNLVKKIFPYSELLEFFGDEFSIRLFCTNPENWNGLIGKNSNIAIFDLDNSLFKNIKIQTYYAGEEGKRSVDYYKEGQKEFFNFLFSSPSLEIVNLGGEKYNKWEIPFDSSKKPSISEISDFFCYNNPRCLHYLKLDDKFNNLSISGFYYILRLIKTGCNSNEKKITPEENGLFFDKMSFITDIGDSNFNNIKIPIYQGEEVKNIFFKDNNGYWLAKQCIVKEIFYSVVINYFDKKMKIDEKSAIKNILRYLLSISLRDENFSDKLYHDFYLEAEKKYCLALDKKKSELVELNNDEDDIEEEKKEIRKEEIFVEIENKDNNDLLEDFSSNENIINNWGKKTLFFFLPIFSFFLIIFYFFSSKKKKKVEKRSGRKNK